MYHLKLIPYLLNALSLLNIEDKRNTYKRVNAVFILINVCSNQIAKRLISYFNKSQTQCKQRSCGDLFLVLHLIVTYVLVRLNIVPQSLL